LVSSHELGAEWSSVCKYLFFSDSSMDCMKNQNFGKDTEIRRR